MYLRQRNIQSAGYYSDRTTKRGMNSVLLIQERNFLPIPNDLNQHHTDITYKHTSQTLLVQFKYIFSDQRVLLNLKISRKRLFQDRYFCCECKSYISNVRPSAKLPYNIYCMKQGPSLLLALTLLIYKHYCSQSPVVLFSVLTKMQSLMHVVTCYQHPVKLLPPPPCASQIKHHQHTRTCFNQASTFTHPSTLTVLVCLHGCQNSSSVM